MRIAVLGCGSIGRRHVRNLIALGETDVLAYDPLAAAVNAVTAETGVRTVTDLEQVWRFNPAVVFITAPSNLHIDLALTAARLGCHLFIEKPLSHTWDGVEELAAEVTERGLVSMVACNMRFHPGPATIKKVLEEGAVGRVVAARIQCSSYLPRWRPLDDYRQSYSASLEWGGAILDCIHEIDLAHWYFGPSKLAGAAVVSATSIGMETDGLAELLLLHQSGVLTNVHLNFIQRDYRRTNQVIGTAGTVYWDFAKGGVVVHGPDGQVTRSVEQAADWELNQMYVDELTHFLQCVAEGRPTMNPVSDSLVTLRIALEARVRGEE